MFESDSLSWWPSLLCWILKCRKSSWNLQYISLRRMLKSKYLTLVLDIDFMTLTILKLEFSFIFLEFIIYLRASSQNFVENHQFNVILSYFRQSLVQYHLLAHHLHCLLRYVDFSWVFFCHHNLLGFVDQYVFKMSLIFFFTNFKISVKFWINFIEHQVVIRSCPLYRACNSRISKPSPLSFYSTLKQ